MSRLVIQTTAEMLARLDAAVEAIGGGREAVAARAFELGLEAAVAVHHDAPLDVPDVAVAQDESIDETAGEAGEEVLP